MGFFSSILGNDSAGASREAATDTYRKQQQAIEGIKSYGDQYAKEFKGMSGAFSPYVQGGNSALRQLLAGLGLGSDQDQLNFTNSYRSLPGYQAGLDTGTQSVARNANAGNMYQSGSTLKALQRFGSNYEDQRSGDYLTRLMGLAGMGQSATGQQVGTEGIGLQGQLGTRQSAFQGGMQSAPTIGLGSIAAAQAQQGALTNLLGMGAKLVGSALGSSGGFGGGGAPMSLGNFGGTGGNLGGFY